MDIRRASTRRGLWLKLSAGVLLLAFVVLSLTDATGLTDVSARAIRLFSPAAGPIAKPKQQDVTESADKVTAPPPANAPFDATQARAHQELWANFLDTKTFTTNSIGMKLALIPPGSFLMGSPDNESFRGNIEGPICEVRITRPYAMGVYPVTVGQFKDFVKEQGYRTEAESSGLGALVLHGEKWEMDANANWRNPGFEQLDNHPVVCVTWNDAKAFCEWLSKKEQKKYTLPTEAQWEYACRAGTQTRFFFGDDEQELFNFVWYEANSQRKTHPVGEKKPNAWGLSDMHGNVWQWAADWHSGSYYSTAQRDNPPGPNAGVYRVVRGGDWICGPEQLRSAYRGYHDGRNSNGGFRVICELTPSGAP